VTNGGVPSTCGGDVQVGVALVGVEIRGYLRGTFDIGLDGRLLGVLTHCQANLARCATNHTLNRWTVVLHCAQPRTLVRSLARRVVRVSMGCCLLTSVLEHLIPFHLVIRKRVGGFALQCQALNPTTAIVVNDTTFPFHLKTDINRQICLSD
jgi:hypothetical protein